MEENSAIEDVEIMALSRMPKIVDTVSENAEETTEENIMAEAPTNHIYKPIQLARSVSDVGHTHLRQPKVTDIRVYRGFLLRHKKRSRH